MLPFALSFALLLAAARNESKCDVGYTECPVRCSPSPPSVPTDFASNHQKCCDINDDCVCDLHCLGNPGGGASDSDPPPEFGFKKERGCSYNHAEGFEVDEGEVEDEMIDKRAAGFLRLIGLIIALPVLLISLYARKYCSGWAQLQRNFGNNQGGAIQTSRRVLGTPLLFRMDAGCCGRNWQMSQKFDKTIEVSASPDHLHLKPVCCGCDLQPLAIPWTNVRDGGLASSCCGCRPGTLLIETRSSARVMLTLDMDVYRQCQQYIKGMNDGAQSSSSAPASTPLNALAPVASGSGVVVPMTTAQPQVMTKTIG